MLEAWNVIQCMDPFRRHSWRNKKKPIRGPVSSCMPVVCLRSGGVCLCMLVQRAEDDSCLPLWRYASCPWDKVSHTLALAMFPLSWLLSQTWWPPCLHGPTKHFMCVLGTQTSVPILVQQVCYWLSHASGPQRFYIINAVCLNFCLDGIELFLPNRMYWFPMRNHWMKVTWSFMKAKIIRKKTWWRKWSELLGKCCPANVEASQAVPAGRALQGRGKPPSPTHKACCLDLSRNFHLPGCLPRQGWEDSHRTVTNSNLILSNQEEQ